MLSVHMAYFSHTRGCLPGKERAGGTCASLNHNTLCVDELFLTSNTVVSLLLLLDVNGWCESKVQERQEAFTFAEDEGSEILVMKSSPVRTKAKWDESIFVFSGHLKLRSLLWP